MNTFQKYPKDWLMLITALAVGITAVLTAGSALSWILVAIWFIVFGGLWFARDKRGQR